jgi:hypothetical protein
MVGRRLQCYTTICEGLIWIFDLHRPPGGREITVSSSREEDVRGAGGGHSFNARRSASSVAGSCRLEAEARCVWPDLLLCVSSACVFCLPGRFVGAFCRCVLPAGEFCRSQCFARIMPRAGPAGPAGPTSRRVEDDPTVTRGRRASQRLIHTIVTRNKPLRLAT